MFKKIAIVGVGLIGGSIGLAAKKNKLAGEVYGIGRRRSSIAKALRKGAIDKGTLSIQEGLKDADLIIIATPVGRVKQKIKECAIYAKEGAIIIDVNSTKVDILEYADKVIEKPKSFIGTHPLAGSEESGVSSASAALFKGSVCVVTPTRHTNRKALAAMKRFWKGLGARIETLSPKEHDRAVAKISHLPHMLSYCLANSVSFRDMKIAGSGFKDTTRIAKSLPNMWSEIFIQNRVSLLASANDFEKNFRQLKSDIKNKRRKGIFKKLDAAKRKRDTIR